MAKRDAAGMMARELTNLEKFDLMIGHMTSWAGISVHNSNVQSRYARLMDELATPAQQATFVKLYGIGWNLNKMLTKNGKIAFGVFMDGTAAWVTPDGKLERAPVGRRTAYLDNSWADVA